MEKTKEQKLASKERYTAQLEKCETLLSEAENIYDYIEAVKYAYSFSRRYNKNLSDIICLDLFREDKFLSKCKEAGILTDWNNTFWFNKEKAESLQQYILENVN